MKVNNFTKEEWKKIKEITSQLPRPRQGVCYCNAQRIATASKKMVYCEGFVGRVFHAWIEFNGKILEVTPRYKKFDSSDYQLYKKYSLEQIRHQILNERVMDKLSIEVGGKRIGK